MASDPYNLATVARACELLRAFSGEHETLRLNELISRTGINKTIVFRLVHTLVRQGLLDRTSQGAYRPRYRLLDRKRFRVGYAAQADNSPFSNRVTDSIHRAAAREGIELILLDNHYSPTVALKNARRLVEARVDVALEFQTYERVAPAVSTLFREAGIPLIAIEIPHPAATFYGADNYCIGLLAGRLLGRWAKQHWTGQVDEVLMLELGVAGSVPQLRLAGAEAGLLEVLPRIRREQFFHIDAKGEFIRAFEQVRHRLQRSPMRRTLLAGVNDPVALGALRAFEEAGRAQHCAVVGMGAIPEACAELRKPASRLIGSIAFLPERYGDDIIQLVLDILQRKPVPPAVYARHQLVTASSVDHLYPAWFAPEQAFSEPAR